MDIASQITAVKGIGEKTQKAFAKMGVYTVGDILLHFPRDYVKFPEITDIDELNNVNESSTYAIHAVIKKAPVVKNTARMQITLQDIGSPGHMIQLVWYRMPYLKAQLVQDILYFTDILSQRAADMSWSSLWYMRCKSTRLYAIHCSLCIPGQAV